MNNTYAVCKTGNDRSRDLREESRRHRDQRAALRPRRPDGPVRGGCFTAIRWTLVARLQSFVQGGWQAKGGTQ